MTAGLETLRIITENPDYTERITAITTALTKGLAQAAEESHVPVCIHQSGSMFSLFFSDTDVLNFNDANGADQEAFTIYFKAMLEQGIYLPPSQFETCFVSGVHTKEIIEQTIEAAKKAFQKVAASRA